MKGARGRNPVSGHFPYHGLAYNQKPKEERMASVNKVILVGNLGKDPELSYTPSGVAVCKFSVATTDKWAGQDGSLHEKTEWHRIVVWKKTAENCAKYLRKGSPAYIEGRLQTRSWDDLQSGQKRYSTEIVADNVKFLGSAQGAAREAPPVPNSAAPDWDMPAEGGSMDDVQF